MDTIALSRLQFAVTSMFHFIFVPLTLGLSILTAYMETRYVTSGDELYLKMTKFWGKLFLINFAMGVVTGIVMEFQFGTNWAAYSRFVGDVFGSALAAEGIFAFFLESGFLALLLVDVEQMVASAPEEGAVRIERHRVVFRDDEVIYGPVRVG